MTTASILKYNIKNLLTPQILGFFFAILGYILITTHVPLDTGLSLVGQRMLGILVFAVVIWMTEAVDYSVSAFIIGSLMIGLLTISPDPNMPTKLIGSTEALRITVAGFSSPATVLVASALAIAASMTKTGLDRRLALYILSLVGAKTKNIFLGSIIVGILLAFLVPSATARCSCMVPIVMGMIAAFEMDRKSRFAALMMISVPTIVSIWNMGIPTAAAQNLVALGFFESEFGVQMGWLEWVKIMVPFSLTLTAIVYFAMLFMIKPEVDEIKGGSETIKRDLKELGPMSLSEKKLLGLFAGLLFLWSTYKVLHDFDTSSVTFIAVALMLIPGIGVMSWKEIQTRIPWGTLVLFGISISLGTAMLKMHAASWLAGIIAATLGLDQYSVFMIVAMLGGFLIIVHLGFASATALTSSMLPILISIFQGLDQVTNPMGLTLIMQTLITFGFILPVNAPQNMVAYGTDTFETKEFIRIGLVITLLAFGLLLIFTKTYWAWIGVTA